MLFSWSRNDVTRFSNHIINGKLREISSAMKGASQERIVDVETGIVHRKMPFVHVFI